MYSSDSEEAEPMSFQQTAQQKKRQDLRSGGAADERWQRIKNMRKAGTQNLGLDMKNFE